jgi:hypothetical protein
MGRPHLEFISSTDVDEREQVTGQFTGLATRVLSKDDETDAYTALMRAPDGWSGTASDPDRPVEIFMLKGAGTLGEHALAVATYAFLPAGAEGAELTLEPGALALVMVDEPGSAPSAREVLVIDTHELRFDDPRTPGVPPGLVIKLLHVDEDRGDWTWLASTTPGWQEDRAEVHPTVEEALVLRGDVLLGGRGEMGPGDYFWRPPDVRHGPMFTRKGHVIFFRTKGGGMNVSYEEVPGWREIVEAYREKEPFYGG